MREALRRLAPWIAAAALAALYAPGLARHLAYAADPLTINDDVTQHVAPYLPAFRALDPGNDYINHYLRACHPIGYRLLYTAAAAVMDPRPFSKILTFALYAAFLAFLAAAAGRSTGWTGALFVVAGGLSADVFLDRMQGGLVRAFAFPLFAAFLYGVLRGRVRWIIGAGLAGAAFYPTIAVTAGLALAVLLLLLPARLRGDAEPWPLQRRILTLGVVASLMAALMTPTVISLRPFGPLLDKHAEARYPEAGPGGRGGDHPSADFDENPARALTTYTAKAFASGRTWLKHDPARLAQSHKASALLALALLAVAVARRDGPALRLAAALATILGTYGLAVAVSPHLYLPERYVLFSLPVIGLAAIPLGIQSLFQQRTALKSATLLACTMLLLAVEGGPVEPRLGFCNWPRALKPALDGVATLPPDAVVAAWPNTCDLVPYATGRRVLVSYETHLAFHERYVLKMRERMNALIAAFSATEPGPIFALRDHGATHLLVHASQLEADPPYYFHPFDEGIRKARGGTPPEQLALRRLLPAAVWNADGFYILDLSRLDNAL
jgi:hypothetical protein